MLEVLDAIIDSWGSPRQVGIKICPTDDYNDTTVSYEELSETYEYLIKEIVARKLAFINLSRRGCDVSRAEDDFFKPQPRPAGKELPLGYDPLPQFGRLVKHPGSATMLMVNHEYTVEEADALVKEGKIDLVGFSRPFICNPVSSRRSFLCIDCVAEMVKDLITRVKLGIDFAVNDRGGHVNYGPYETVDEGYNDWPTATQDSVVVH